MRLDRHRSISSGLFVLAFLALLGSSEPDVLVALGPALAMGILIIWQAEAFASLTGLRFGSVDSASPAPLVRFLGWLFFLTACGASVRMFAVG